MTPFDEYINSEKLIDIRTLLDTATITLDNCQNIYNVIIEQNLIENFQLNFADDKNLYMMELFNRTMLSFTEFAPLYGTKNLLPSFTTFYLDYAVNSGIKLENKFTNNNIQDIDGFENFSKEIKDIFYILSNAYFKIIEVFDPQNNGPATKYVKLDDGVISFLSKGLYIVYYEEFYSNGILSTGHPIVKEEKPKEKPKTTSAPSKKRKSTKKENKVENVQEKVEIEIETPNIDDIRKTIISEMSDAWINDDKSWFTISSNLYGLPDDSKTVLFESLEKKFDMKLEYNFKNKNYIFKVKLK